MPIEAFQNLLKGNYFEAIVDHRALIHIVKSKHEPRTMRLKRIVEKLSGYSFELKFCLGSLLRLVDFLSRHSNAEDLEKLLKSTSTPVGDITESQRQDIIKSPIALLSSEFKPVFPSLSNCSDDTLVLQSLAEQGVADDDKSSDEIFHENSSEMNFGVKTRSSGSATSIAPARVTHRYAKSNNLEISSDLSKYPVEWKKRSRDPLAHIPMLPPIPETWE